jgi:hypothetical protein
MSQPTTRKEWKAAYKAAQEKWEKQREEIMAEYDAVRLGYSNFLKENCVKCPTCGQEYVPED